MKKFLALTIVCSLLLTTGCGNGDEPSSTEQPNEVVVEPTLYSIGSAMDLVYADAGCTGDEDDAEVITKYLESFGTTPKDFLTELETNPSTSTTIARILKASGISMSEVDWSSVDEIYEFAGFNTTTPIVDTDVELVLTADRDKFVDIVTHYGVADYWNKLNSLYESVDVSIDRPDETLLNDMLNEWSIQDVMSKFPSTCRIIDDNTIEVKVNDGSKSYYEMARRNEHKYVSFYPYNDDGSGALYMRNTYEESEVPLWEVYFCAYMSYLQSSTGVSATNGVVNNTEDGIEIWWSPSTGYTVSLYVYESGLIRLTYGTDDRYSDYIDDITSVDSGSSTTVKAAVKDKICSEFNMSNTTFDTFVTMAQVFNLPCASCDLNAPADTLSQESMQQWLDAAAIFNTYLRAVDKAYQTDITAYEFSIHLADFAAIGRDASDRLRITGTTEAISEESTDYKSMSEQDGSKVDVYKQFTDDLLNAVGSKSYFMIENYNAFLTNITYVFSGTDRSEEIATKMQAFKDNEVLLAATQIVFDKYTKNDISSAIAGNYSNVDQSRLIDILSCVESNYFYNSSTVGDVQRALFNWLTYGRSDVTAENINSVDVSTLSDYENYTLQELKANRSAQDTFASILNKAIKFTDLGVYTSGAEIVKSLINNV